jgi:hypothetical protein
VSAYIMKSPGISIAVQVNNDIETRKFISKEIAGLLKP